MDDKPFWLEEYHGTTWIHPLGMAMLAVAAIFILLAPRRYALWPIIWVGCLVAPAQRIVIFGMDWTILRLTLLAGMIRVAILFGQVRPAPKLRAIDGWFAAWLCSGVLIYFAREPTSAALINRLGWSFEYAAAYLLVRYSVRSWKDIRTLALGATIISVPIAAAFINEQLTRYNIFHFFGGVREFTWIRDGRLRCQGAYAHPILAGTYWAVLLPLIASQFFQGGQSRRFAAVGGSFCALAIVAMCASSGPIGSVAAAMFGAGMYIFRKRITYIQIAAVFALIVIHFVREPPVWHLISRLNIIGGSTGWHRYNLMDQWIRNVDNWFFLGTSSTASWDRFPVTDITNQYVLEAIRGGALTLFMFVGMLLASFKAVGTATRSMERIGRIGDSRTAWAIGVMLFVHAVSFFGVSYFGQIIVLLAMVPALAACVAEIAQSDTQRMRNSKKRRVRRIRRTRPIDPEPSPSS